MEECKQQVSLHIHHREKLEIQEEVKRKKKKKSFL